MAKGSIGTALAGLKTSLERIKALLAWEQLKKSEATPDRPPAFKISDPTATDLRNEYSSFLFKSVQINRLIDSSTNGSSHKTLGRIRRELTRIEREARSLGLRERFCRLNRYS
jgi:hypothetical protein